MEDEDGDMGSMLNLGAMSSKPLVVDCGGFHTFLASIGLGFVPIGSEGVLTSFVLGAPSFGLSKGLLWPVEPKNCLTS